MKRWALLIFFFVISILFFRSWFIYAEITGGDWPYFFNDFIKSLPLLVPSWGSYHGNGLGGIPVVYPLESYLYLVSSLFVEGINIPWDMASKVFYFGLFIVGSLCSIYYLINVLCPRIRLRQLILALFIYSTNTYILMIVGGGQMGVALAYAFAPWALGHWINLIREVISEESNVVGKAIAAGISFGVIILFDARIAYLIAIAVCVYFSVFFITQLTTIYNPVRCDFIRIIKKAIYVFGLPIIISFFLHASWLLPIIVYKTTPLDSLAVNYISTSSFIFYSFATFSNAISLLHPNWPENIFGKIYFLRPEFLLLPIISFFSLLSLRGVTKRNLVYKINTLFLATIGLMGIFLAKGANEPFGFINTWLYKNIPGFTLFRDPTKFYLYIIFSYSVLIPVGIEHLFIRAVKLLKRKAALSAGRTSILNSLFYFIFIVFWLVLTRQAVFGQLQGTFVERSIPDDYLRFKNILNEEKTFFRSLWLPRQHRFTFYSNTHPSIEALLLLRATNSAELLTNIDQPGIADQLKSLAIKYLIIPADPNGEIFIKDRKYDDHQRQALIHKLDSLFWLTKKISFQKLVVYELIDHFGRFQLTRDGELISESIPYQELDTSHYRVEVSIDQPATLVFSENYNPYWLATINGKEIKSEPNTYRLNSFKLNQSGSFLIDVTFAQRKVYNYGSAIAIVAIIAVLMYFTISFLQKNIFKKNAK